MASYPAHLLLSSHEMIGLERSLVVLSLMASELSQPI
jgi:hypothetical protein